MTAQLALGTVQFGLPYGVTNPNGQPVPSTVRDVLALSRERGVAMLDTAHAYGTAEQVVGESLEWLDSTAEMVTKVPPLLFGNEARIADDHVERARAAFEQSLRHLRQARVHGLMVHRGTDLLAPGSDNLWRMLEEERDAGRAGRIGASVYTPEEADALLSRYPLEIIQIPSNLYDARFKVSGCLGRLADAGVEVHVRSLFLQGILLAAVDALPPFVAHLRDHHAAYLQDAERRGLTGAAACLAPWLRDPDVAFVVVGCQTVAQLGEILDAAEQARLASDEDCRALAQDHVLTDSSVLNPAEWGG